MAQQSLDAYMELENVKGESQDRTMTMNIQLRSFELGFEAGGGEVGDLKKLQETRKELTKKKPLDVAKLQELDEKIDELLKELGERSDESSESPESMGMSERQADLAKRFTFKIAKDTDRSSPALFKGYMSTSDPHKKLVYPTATIRVRRTGVTNRSPTPYLLLDFTQLMVVGWKLQSESDSVPKESVTFSFKTYTMSYYPQNADGSAGSMAGPVGWDFDKNEKI